MNCSPCQERLDERLDLLRTRVQEGSVSRADARAQGAAALQEIVRDCAECESELRTHLNVRLALLDSELETISVPPELRLNVRRALERESLPLRRASRSPWMGFAWTGGSVFLALGLFLIARPLLIEQSQKSPGSQSPVPSTIESVQVPEVPSAAMKNGGSAPQKSVITQRKAPSKPSTAVSPSAMTTALPQNVHQPQNPTQLQSTSIPPAKTSSRLIVPPPAPAVSSKAPVGQGERLRQNSTSSNVAISPQAKATFPERKQTPQNELRLSPSPAKPPHLFDNAATPVPQAPPPPGASQVKPRVAAPNESQLQEKSEPNTDQNLGLEVHFVADRTNRFMSRNGFGGARGGGGGFGGANADAATNSANNASTLAVPASPAPVVSAEQRARSSENVAKRGNDTANTSGEQNTNNSQNNASNPPPPRGKTKTPAPANSTSSLAGVGAAKNNPGAAFGPGLTENARVQQRNRVFNASDAPPFVSVSVINAVPNARITGKIKEKSEEALLLWMGDLWARQPVSVSLAPLGIVTKDQVEIAVEQQIAPGQTKKLAMTTIVAP